MSYSKRCMDAMRKACQDRWDDGAWAYDSINIDYLLTTVEKPNPYGYKVVGCNSVYFNKEDAMSEARHTGSQILTLYTEDAL